MCKEKDVGNVNAMMSAEWTQAYRILTLLADSDGYGSMAYGNKELDNHRSDDTIMLTEHGGTGAEQTIVPTASRDAEPASGRRHSRELPAKRVLRPGGPAASQVRDASARRYRKEASQSSRQNIR